MPHSLSLNTTPIPTLTLDGDLIPDLPSCSAQLWRPIWNTKSLLGENIAQLSGRTYYTELETWVLLADAVYLLGLKAEDDLLDIGCAAGFLGNWLCQKIKRYVGIDYAIGSVLKFGWPKAAIADARALPFRDGEFGKTYMGSVLLCMSKDECLEALTEMRRVTLTRGVVADTLIGPHRGKHDKNRVTWFESRQEVEGLMRKAGWSKVQFVKMHPILPHYKRAINAVLTP